MTIEKQVDKLFKIRKTCSGGAKEFAAVFAVKLFPRLVRDKTPCWCFDESPVASRNEDFYPKYTITYHIDSSIEDGGYYKLIFANNGKHSGAVFATFELAYAGLYKHNQNNPTPTGTNPTNTNE